VHVWSGFAALGYVVRPYQVVRSRRINLPASHNLPPHSAMEPAQPRRNGNAGDS
jgi:hypothetical protein